jgi:hypothetical protein
VEGYDSPISTGVGNEPQLPVGARLIGNHPNPFNPSTTIAYELDRSQRLVLAVYDARGRLVTTLVDGIEGAGRHETAWNGVDRTGVPVASGVYFARLQVDGRSETKRMVLLK